MPYLRARARAGLPTRNIRVAAAATTRFRGITRRPRRYAVAEGQKVLAIYENPAHFYSATICKVNDDGTIDLESRAGVESSTLRRGTRIVPRGALWRRQGMGRDAGAGVATPHVRPESRRRGRGRDAAAGSARSSSGDIVDIASATYRYDDGAFWDGAPMSTLKMFAK